MLATAIGRWYRTGAGQARGCGLPGLEVCGFFKNNAFFVKDVIT